MVVSRNSAFCQTSLNNTKVSSGTWNGIAVLKNFVGDIDFSFAVGGKPINFALRIYRNGTYTDLVPTETCTANGLFTYNLRDIELKSNDVVRYFYTWSGSTSNPMLRLDATEGYSVYINITEHNTEYVIQA